MRGRVKIVSRLLIAVSVIDSAVSPFDIWLIRFEVTPPGAAAKTISPTASSGLRVKIFAMIKAMVGKTMS